MTDSLAHARSLIRQIPDFPLQGIMFQDLTPLLASGEAFGAVIEQLSLLAEGADFIAGIEARGFIFAAAIAHSLSIGFVPIRKKGKLPFLTHDESYGLEYGQDIIQVHQDAVTAGAKVLLVDDVLATGGTMLAGVRLFEKLGAEIVGLATVIEISQLGGRQRIADHYPRLSQSSVFSI